VCVCVCVCAQISCDSTLVIPSDVTPSARPEEALRLSPAAAPPWVPLLSMELFVSEALERRPVGPCVISAYDRLYVQVSASLKARADDRWRWSR